jgi:hypothetical protein
MLLEMTLKKKSQLLRSERLKLMQSLRLRKLRSRLTAMLKLVLMANPLLCSLVVSVGPLMMILCTKNLAHSVRLLVAVLFMSAILVDQRGMFHSNYNSSKH